MIAVLGVELVERRFMCISQKQQKQPQVVRQKCLQRRLCVCDIELYVTPHTVYLLSAHFWMQAVLQLSVWLSDMSHAILLSANTSIYILTGVSSSPLRELFFVMQD